MRVSGSPRAAGFLRRARSRGLAAGDRVRAERELARALVHPPLDGLRGRRDDREGDDRRVVRVEVRARVHSVLDSVDSANGAGRRDASRSAAFLERRWRVAAVPPVMPPMSHAMSMVTWLALLTIASWYTVHAVNARESSVNGP